MLTESKATRRRSRHRHKEAALRAATGTLGFVVFHLVRISYVLGWILGAHSGSFFYFSSPFLDSLILFYGISSFFLWGLSPFFLFSVFPPSFSGKGFSPFFFSPSIWATFPQMANGSFIGQWTLSGPLVVRPQTADCKTRWGDRVMEGPPPYSLDTSWGPGVIFKTSTKIGPKFIR